MPIPSEATRPPNRHSSRSRWLRSHALTWPGTPSILVVGGHHASNLAFVHSRLHGQQKLASQRTLRHADGTAVGSGLGRGVGRKVLCRGHHAVQGKWHARSLQPANGSEAHARHVVRVFSVHLVASSPTRIAREVQVRPEDPARAPGTGLGGNHGEHTLHKGGVPGGTEGHRCGKACRALGHQSVNPFVHDEGRIPSRLRFRRSPEAL